MIYHLQCHDTENVKTHSGKVMNVIIFRYCNRLDSVEALLLWLLFYYYVL